MKARQKSDRPASCFNVIDDHWVRNPSPDLSRIPTRHNIKPTTVRHRRDQWQKSGLGDERRNYKRRLRMSEERFDIIPSALWIVGKLHRNDARLSCRLRRRGLRAN